MKDLVSRYRRHGESLLIEMKLNTLAQLFNSLDPSPFLEKDLDDDAEAYIVETAREFPLKTSLHLVIHLPPDAIEKDTAESVAHAIHNYFDYKTQIADAELRHKLRQGRVSLVIGLLFLAACLSAREARRRPRPRYALRISPGGPAHQRLGGDVAPDPDFSLRLVADPQPAHALLQTEPHQGGRPSVFLSAQTPWTKPAACPCPTA